MCCTSILDRWLVKGNNFTGFAKGAPELYLGRVVNVTIVGNSYFNNRGIKKIANKKKKKKKKKERERVDVL
jgi:hypothetical protein